MDALASVSRKPDIVPFLWFDDRAEEAVNHYLSIFPDSRIAALARYGNEGPGAPGSVMTVEFELSGHRFIALNGGPYFKFTEAVSFSISCVDQTELDYYWTRLGEGGEEGQCGWLKDKFGLSWQVTPAELGNLLAQEDEEKAQRVMQAMLAMKKIVIAELRAAAG